MAEKPLVHLIDGHIYIFRSYFSLPEMSAPDGTPTNAAYGFANTLLRYLAEQAPTHMAVCFDYDVNASFRNETFPDYKANRGEPPEDLEPQFDLCVEVGRALGLPVFVRDRYEADDLIATLTRQLLAKGARVRIVTSDKDLSQLVRDDGRVQLYDLAKDSHMDADGVRAKFGVDPDQIPDYLGLVGDAVDNLPGVPGVGPKSAAAVLGAFGRIEHVPADPAEWSEVAVRGAKRLAAKIEEHRELALRVRELATVHQRVPGIDVGLGELRFRGADRDKATALFDRLGWGRIATRIPRWRDAAPRETENLARLDGNRG
ncbi:MAG: hypothetical protein O7A09_03625 [Proteobacteria bacterium]|nr:hypothetical protein [Pseudomonadota bacterium]